MIELNTGEGEICNTEEGGICDDDDDEEEEEEEGGEEQGARWMGAGAVACRRTMRRTVSKKAVEIYEEGGASGEEEVPEGQGAGWAGWQAVVRRRTMRKKRSASKAAGRDSFKQWQSVVDLRGNDGSIQRIYNFWLNAIRTYILPVSSRSTDLTGSFTEGGTPRLAVTPRTDPPHELTTT